MTTRAAPPESVEAFKAQVKQIVERAFNEGQLDDLALIYAPTIVRHQPPNPDIVGLDAFKQYVLGRRAAFPDLIVRLEEITIEGTTMAGRWSLQGTHTGPLTDPNVPPTGKPVMMTGLFFLHMRDGLNVEEWSYGDTLGMFRQLGLLPPPPPNA